MTEQFQLRIERLSKSISAFLRLKKTVNEIDRMNQNEIADKPALDKLQSLVQNIKEEQTMKNPLDINKDGTVNKKDLEAFLSTSNILWSVVFGVLISAFLDTLDNWWETGLWSWELIIICAKFDIFPAIIAFVKKLFDKSDYVKNKLIEQLKQQNQSKDLTNQLLQQKIDLQLIPK